MHRTAKAISIAAACAPLAAACVGDRAVPDSQDRAEEIIGGFPGTSPHLDAVGALAIPASAVFEDERAGEVPEEALERSYLEESVTYPADAEYLVFCTGTLIDHDVVLTAEHCVDDLFGDEEFVIGFDGNHPDRAVAIESVMAEDTVEGGAIGFGSDVAVAYLEEPVEDVEPAQIGSLSDDEVDTDYVNIGYGVQNNDRDQGTRMLGAVTLRGIGGNMADHLFGDFEGFLDHVDELGIEAQPEEIYEALELIDDYEATFGHAPGNAQSCFGDSGGPVMRGSGGDLTVYALTSWGLGTEDLICDWGGAYAVLGPAVEEFLDRAVACPGLPAEGMCDGDVAMRCAPPEEGGWRPVETDCSVLGLTCGEEDGEVTCLEDPCEGVPEEGVCDGDTVRRCTEDNEGDRRVVETDCSVLGMTCGTDDGGADKTCVE